MTKGLGISSLYNPSVIFFAKMPPPFTQGRLTAESHLRVASYSCMARQSVAHSCATGSIRAMPENEISVLRGIFIRNDSLRPKASSLLTFQQVCDKMYPVDISTIYRGA